MDVEEDEFVSGNHSDDGGGTPVQDEHPASDAEDARSDQHQSEDEGSNEDAPQPMDTSGAMSDSDDDGPRKERGEDSDDERQKEESSDIERPKDDDSDDERPKKRDKSSDIERPKDDDSDDERPKVRDESSDVERMKDDDSNDERPKERDEHIGDEARGRDPSIDLEQTKEHDDVSSASDDECPAKRRKSASEDESPAKRRQSDDGEPSSSPKRRRSTSDAEDGARETKRALKTDSGSEKHDSDSDAGVRKKTRQLDSNDEGDETRGKDGEKGEEEEKKSGKWKGVMQSDERAKAQSDGEQENKDKDSDDEDDRPVKRKKAVLSDSDDEDEDRADKPVKRSRAVSDGDDSDSGSCVGPDKAMAAKLRELGSASEDEEDEAKTEGKKDEKALFGSDSDSGEDEEEKMIADIFGESGDEEEEEFTGFNQEDLEQEKKEAPQKQQQQEEDSDSDEGVERGGIDTSMMSDFDIMLAKRKAMNSKRRKHRDGGTFISDADDVVSAMINKMTEAAEEDRTLNSQKKPALKKLTLLPQVVMHLKKQDLKETFIDSGVMSAIKEWISPLPDKSLPALRIREELLRILQELPSVSQETLKHSGIGRSVMFLYKHPKESRTNKDLALKLINEWSRPIFGLTSNFKGMTREERQQRDLDQQMPQKRRLSQPQKVERALETDVFSPPISSGGQTPRRDLEKQLTGEEKALRPGDPGFCARARVPMPSNKDYVVRPKWNVEGDSSRYVKKNMSLLEKHKRRFAEERKQKRPQGAVKISIEGNRMPL
ncbi:uncharacterized protein iws1 isoform X2 [Eucyclogobius newberryi]|uniref:uncharacterized protein iws1 isoform X2 n=1 Tax=Eucyclogobius newberryi TaxID=166745 RepID=UPI003B5C8167